MIVLLYSYVQDIRPWDKGEQRRRGDVEFEVHLGVMLVLLGWCQVVG